MAGGRLALCTCDVMRAAVVQPWALASPRGVIKRYIPAGENVARKMSMTNPSGASPDPLF